jgi:hypothetical protein
MPIKTSLYIMEIKIESSKEVVKEKIWDKLKEVKAEENLEQAVGRAAEYVERWIRKPQKSSPYISQRIH